MKPRDAPRASPTVSAETAPTAAIASPLPGTPPAPLLSPGDVLAGRFRILRLLGQGGMGEVHEAEDLELGERVAVKAIRSDLAQDPRAMERFKRETQLARKVTHPNVCRIFHLEYHREGGREVAFLTMELLQGETLTERLRAKGRMSPVEAQPLVAQIAEGLAAAHRAGIVHRDLKPSNVILVPAPEGTRVVITDFGIACLSGEGPTASDEGSPVLAGTMDYLAPELAEGREATPACDIYSLGIVIHEMLTGARPHSGRTRFLRRWRRHAGPPRPPVLDLDPLWQATILRCLDPDPARRFATSAEVVSALAGERPGRPRPWPNRPWIVVAAVAVLLTPVAWRLWRPSRAPRPAPGSVAPVQVTTSAGLDVFPSFSPGGESIAYASDRSGAFQIYVKSLAAGGAERQVTLEGDNFQPAWSPDGERIAYHTRRGGIWLVPARGGAAKPLTKSGSHPAWSPDGALLAFQSEPLVDLAANAFPALPPSTLWIVSRDGGQPRQLTRPGQPPGGHGAPSWSPDGRRIVFSTADRRLAEIWSVSADGSDLVRLVQDQPYAFDPVYAPDGTRVYYCSWSGRFTYGIWSVRVSPRDGRSQGLPSEEVNLGPLRLRHSAVSKDGRIAYSGLTLTSNLWSVPLSPSHERAGSPRPLTAENGKNARPSFSPDGRRIAFDRGRPGNATDIWVMDAGGGNPLPLTTHRAEDDLASWFPGGDRVAFLSNRSGRFALWSVGVDGGGEGILLDLGDDVDWPRLSPDGTRIAFNSKRGEGTINTWVVTLPRGEPRQVTFDPELMGFPTWSPDGKLLAVEVKRGEHTHVAVLPSSGGAAVQLTSDDGQSWPYSWSPDADVIAFAGLREGVWNVWSVSRSTGEQTRLTDHTRLNTYVRTPAWSPLGDRIVYEYAETTGNVWMVDAPR